MSPTPSTSTTGTAPAPAWLGGLALLLLTLGTLVLLGYTLLDLPWQQRLGGWNYVVGAALISLVSIPLRYQRRARPAPSP